MTPINVANVMKLFFRNPILLSSPGPSVVMPLNIFCSLPIVNWRLVQHNINLYRVKNQSERFLEHGEQMNDVSSPCQ